MFLVTREKPRSCLRRTRVPWRVQPETRQHQKAFHMERWACFRRRRDRHEKRGVLVLPFLLLSSFFLFCSFSSSLLFPLTLSLFSHHRELRSRLHSHESHKMFAGPLYRIAQGTTRSRWKSGRMPKTFCRHKRTRKFRTWVSRSQPCRHPELLRIGEQTNNLFFVTPRTHPRLRSTRTSGSLGVATVAPASQQRSESSTHNHTSWWSLFLPAKTSVLFHFPC